MLSDKATFTRRQTVVPGTQPIGLSDAFAEDATKQVQRRAFLKKNKLQTVNLAEVIRYAWPLRMQSRRAKDLLRAATASPQTSAAKDCARKRDDA